MVKVGIIGGSGLDNPNILEDAKAVFIETPYGALHSDAKTGKISGVDVVLLARHGKNHTIPPSNVNYRANLWALQALGCTHILATTAVGSLREEIGRGDLVIIDQFIDFTKHRKSTFFDNFDDGPKHTPMAEPFDKELRSILINVCKELGFKCHNKGTVATIEGPRFSTRAESNMFRAFADVVNMSIATEAILANEIGIPYAAVAMSTDYDCWKTDENAVSWAGILEIFNKNVEKVTKLLVGAVGKLAPKDYSSKKLIVFDMDGTLTASKSAMDAEMAALFVDLLRKYDVAVISGGKWEQFEKQFITVIDKMDNFDKELLKKLYLFPTCSTAFYKFDGKWVKQYAEALDDDEKERIFDAFKLAFELGPYKIPEEIYGDVLEDRDTQITFSALGQEAPVELKRVWDPDRRKRLEIIEFLRRMIPEFEIRVGGTTSIDVTRKGIDKAYGVRKINSVLGFDFKDILFVGDALFESGNDYPVKSTGVDCVSVSDCEDTKKLVRSLISV